MTNELMEKIVKIGSKWQVQSENGRNMGTYDTKAEAEKRLQQVHYFKYANEELNEAGKNIRSTYSDIKNITNKFDSTHISKNDIVINLPDPVKEQYVAEINALIDSQGRLLNYLDDTTGKQIHHINLKSLGGAVNDLNNFIVVYPKDHLNIHRNLSKNLHDYLEAHPKEIAKYKDAVRETSNATSVLALNAEVPQEEFIREFYNMSKSQSQNRLQIQQSYSERRLNANNTIINDANARVLINFIKDQAGNILPDYDHPVIKSTRQAAAFLLTDEPITKNMAPELVKKIDNKRVDIRDTANKNTSWIQWGFAPFNGADDFEGQAWLILNKKDFDNLAITTESLLEDTRTQLISKSRSAGQYKDQSRGKNRFERKKHSHIANQVKSYNQIDMNDFFKKDLLEVKIPVTGETNQYIVTIKLDGICTEIQKNIKNNKNKLEYRTIIQAITKVFNTSDVYVKCTCADFQYRFNHWSIVNNYGVDDSAHDPGPGKGIANPNNDKGIGCKHILLVLANCDWIMKVASVINNYIHYAEEHMQKPFLKVIFPKLYGIQAEEMVEQDLIDDDKYLDSSVGLIDAINEYGKTRGRYKAGTNKNPVTGTGGRTKKAAEEPEEE